MDDIYFKGLKAVAKLIMTSPGSKTEPVEEKVIPKALKDEEPKAKATSTCIPCAIDHTGTVCGVLSESVRFARREGIGSSDVQRRIAKAEEELNAMERLDLAPEETRYLTGKQRDLVNWLAVESKNLRDRLKEIRNLSDLENVTADACRLRLKFRVQSLGLPEEVVNISRKVETGEMTEKDAISRIQELTS